MRQTPSSPRRAGRYAALAALAALLATACSDTPVATPRFESTLAPGVAAISSNTAGRRVGDSIPGSWIVQFSPGVSDVRGMAAQLERQHGGRLAYVYETALRGFAIENLPDQAVAALQRNPNVRLLEADRVASATGTEYPTPSWGIDRIDQAARPLNSTFTYANEGAGVNVYILDTGIRQSHVEFGGRAVAGFTAYNDGRGT
ncbi:MAG TPA: hypothetical protein VFV33_06835, partial [Gemmatimonadaceae bacterium]|nr:hypothetical protein [Gemmatimonadaceae bacterium]